MRDQKPKRLTKDDWDVFIEYLASDEAHVFIILFCVIFLTFELYLVLVSSLKNKDNRLKFPMLLYTSGTRRRGIIVRF